MDGRTGGRVAAKPAGGARAPVAPASSTAESSARAFGDAMVADRIVGRGPEARRGASAPPAAGPPPGAGQPLTPSTRDYFEARTGADLGSVRVDASPRANAAARGLGARAYAYGEYIGFAQGQWAPDTGAGQRLLGHELAHVLQARAASTPPVIQRDCDPTIATCPEEPTCDAMPPETVPEVEEYSCPADFGLDVDVSGPPSFGSTAPGTAERVHLANPIYSRRREDYYLVPVAYVFLSPEDALRGSCRAPGTDPGADTTSGDGPTPDPAPTTDPVATSSPATPTFVPGQTVYTLDGPLEVTAATGDYVVTNVYTKFAVGAGSMTLVLTAGGYVLVDAGMHQVGGNINDTLADAAVQRLADALGGAPLGEVFITHIHADHTALLPRVYARWEIGTLRINALQALLPSRTGTGTQLDDLARSMIAARRTRIESQVRTDLTASFGPWDLFIDPAAREASLSAEIAAETTRRMTAMRPTNVELALPSGGSVVAASMPLGSVALPPGFAFDSTPITRGAGGGGVVTLLDPRASTVTAAAAAGNPPTGAMVDTQSSSYVIDMPGGAQLIVVSDQRVDDLLALQRGFEDQLARFGTPRTFRVWDMTHHLQVGFAGATGIVRSQQLAALTRMLSDFIDARNSGGSVVGDALIVSVHGPGTGSDSYIDPANAWLLSSLGMHVYPATGGSSTLTAAQDMSILEVQLDATSRISGIAGPPFPAMSSSDYLLRRGAAATAQLDGAIQRRQLERADAVEADYPTIDADIASLTARRDGIQAAIDAYTRAVVDEIGRSTRGPTNARPDITPAIGGTEPAATEAAALRTALVGFDAPVVGVVPRFTPGALVVLGQQGSAGLDPATRALFDARARVVELAAGLRWSSPVERRTEVANALDAYRTQLLAARTSVPGTTDVIDRELARIDVDLQRLVGMSGAALREVRAAVELAAQLERNRAQARTVESVHALLDNATALDIIANNGGFAMVGPTLYRLTQNGEAITFSTVPMLPVSVPRAAEAAPPPALPPPAVAPSPPPSIAAPLATTSGGGLARPAAPGPIMIPAPLPAELAAFPNIINFSGRTVIFEGGTVLTPTPSQPLSAARPGELIVRGYSSAWVVCDPVTRLPVAGAAVGGETWQVESNGSMTLLVDAFGNVQAGSGPRVVTRNLAETALGGRVGTVEPPMARGPSGGTRAVAGAVGLIVLANEILGPIGNILNLQRSNIARRRAQAEFWAEFGANPVREMRTQNSNETQPAGTSADTSVFGDPVYDAVTGIDVESLGRTLSARITNYHEFVLWTDLASMLGVLRMTPGRLREPTAEQQATPQTYEAVLQGDPGRERGTVLTRYVDLTSVLRPIEERTLRALDADMRRTVSDWSESERAQIYRLRNGPNTRIARLHGSGWLHGDEPILSGRSMFGPTPWVHVRERRGGRALVEAANADARRSTLMSAYSVHKPIDEVLTEVTEGGRTILSRWPAEGTVDGFVAGPSADGRLGETRYYRHPGADYERIWTVAIGQLNWFWVSEDDLVSLDAGVADDYAAGR